MSSIWSFIGQVVATLGGAAALLVLFAKIWADRSQKRSDHIWQARLEEFKAESKRQQDGLIAGLQFVSSGFSATQELRLNAIKELWNAVLKIREQLDPVLRLHDLAASDPARAAKEAGGILPRTRAQAIPFLPNEYRHLEEHRPFVGETGWVLFAAYSAMVSHIAAKMVRGHLGRRKQLVLWHDDAEEIDAVMRRLDSFPDKTYEDYKSAGPAGLRDFLAFLEQRMVTAFEQSVLGITTVKYSLQEAQHLASALSMSRGLSRSLGRSGRERLLAGIPVSTASDEDKHEDLQVLRVQG